MDGLTFDEVTHTYRWKGAVRPSVTQVLDRLHDFARVPVEVLATAQKRGSLVHLATQLYDENDLVEGSIHDDYIGYLAAWKRFCAEHKPKWECIERALYDETLQIAGTPDRFGFIEYRGVEVFCQVDIKTSATAHPVWGLQTAAYNRLYKRPAAIRLTCQLGADGTYKLREWADATDWPVFASILNLTNWKNKHGI